MISRARNLSRASGSGKRNSAGIITQQLRKIGASCDWSRERFTLDKDYERAVQEVFVKLYNEGLIYRGTRMVNWCPGSLTAISDEEVIPTKQKGFLYYVKYELVPLSGSPDNSLSGSPKATGGSSITSTLEVAASALGGAFISTDAPLGTTEVGFEQFLVVATTRPETIMADVALAVKPGGKWAHLIGRKVIRPLHRTEIPIIGDDAVEEGFGTGVLKVTPAHDKVDYEIGKRHKLEFRDILTPNGKINDPGEHDAAELHGTDRFEARKRSAELLSERGLLLKEEPYENNVGFSERANVPIEPRLSLQWFLKYPATDEALWALNPSPTDNRSEPLIRFHPEHWTKTYAHWLENIQDWCISRQVWWGHRIPVWYKQEGNTNPDPQLLSESSFVLGGKLGGYLEPKCQVDRPEGEGWIQDLDSLDTWFSSWLWAYETMRTEDGTRQKF